MTLAKGHRTAHRKCFPYIPTYDASADGQRFLIKSTAETAGPPPITVVTNWVGKN